MMGSEPAEGRCSLAAIDAANCKYSIADLLRLRPPLGSQKDGVSGGLRLDFVPQDEVAASSRDRQARGSAGQKRGAIGPVTECVPVDGETLQGKRGELRRIEQETGATIRERAGLRGNFTVMITGPSSIVEKALSLVEQALLGGEPPPEEQAVLAPNSAPLAAEPLAVGRASAREEPVSAPRMATPAVVQEPYSGQPSLAVRRLPEPPLEPPPPPLRTAAPPSAAVPLAAAADDEWGIFTHWQQHPSGAPRVKPEEGCWEDDGAWRDSRASALEPFVNPPDRLQEEPTAPPVAALPGRWRQSQPSMKEPLQADGREHSTGIQEAAGPSIPPPPVSPAMAEDLGLVKAVWEGARPAIPVPEAAGPLIFTPPVVDSPFVKSSDHATAPEVPISMPCVAQSSAADQQSLATATAEPEVPAPPPVIQALAGSGSPALQLSSPPHELPPEPPTEAFPTPPASPRPNLREAGALAELPGADDVYEDPAVEDSGAQPADSGEPGKKKKKPKKKKGKGEEAAAKVEAPPQPGKPAARPGPKGKALQQHFSKTAFAGLIDSDSEEEAQQPAAKSAIPSTRRAAGKAAPKPAPAPIPVPPAASSPVPASPPAPQGAAAPAAGPAVPGHAAGTLGARRAGPPPMSTPPPAPSPPQPVPSPPPPARVMAWSSSEVASAATEAFPSAQAAPSRRAKAAPPGIPADLPAPAAKGIEGGGAEAFSLGVWQQAAPSKPAPPPVVSKPALAAEARIFGHDRTGQEAHPPAVPPPPPKPSTKAREPKVKAMNPLPQRTSTAAKAPKAPVMLSRGLVMATGDSSNAATSQRWLERPVEKVALESTHYEEEEDPELACYLWDRRAQRPKNGQARAAPKQTAPPVHAAAQRPPPPPPQRQRALLSQVMEMGFDEPSAKRALMSTGWAGVEEAVAMLLGA